MTNSSLEPGGPDWSCLTPSETMPRSPPINSAVAPPAIYQMNLIDFVTGRPPTGVRARACARVDPDCESPLTAELTPSAAGVLRVPLYQGFDGFLEIEGDEMVPALFFLNGPLERDTQAFPGYLLPLSAVGTLAETIGVPFDPQFGNIGYWALDCKGQPASGVLMSNDAGGQVYNFIEGLPAFQSATVDGLGGFLNVAPGRVLLKGVLSNGGQAVNVQSMLVRASWYSIVNLQPRF